MEITIKLTSATQLDAVIAALEIYVDMEHDRAKDDPEDFKANDKARLAAATKVLATIKGAK